MRYFTADQHLGHANILKFQADTRVDGRGRLFSSIDEHDSFLVARWNAVVGPDDTVYILGDASFKHPLLVRLLSRMQGTKILVVGNHDPYFADIHEDTGRKARAIEKALEAGFAEIHTHLTLEVPGVGKVALSHFPYAQPPGSLPSYEERHLARRPAVGDEVALIHGHIHTHWTAAAYKKTPPMVNVGVDVHHLTPVSESQVIALLGGPIETARHPAH